MARLASIQRGSGAGTGRSPIQKNTGSPATARRRGAVVVYFAFGLTLFLGIGALVLDMGFRYHRKAEAQRAADAAALAGAFYIGSGASVAESWAKYYAAQNGYNLTPGQAGYDSTNIVNAQFAPDGNKSHYKVSVSRVEPIFFSSLFSRTKPRIGAAAMAEYISNAELNITGGGSYGVNGPVTLSTFGPDGYYNNGDPFSTKYLTNGQANPQHNGFHGYDFAFTIPSDYQSLYPSGTSKTKKKQVELEIFDPDTYNKNGATDADGTNTVDEYRKPDGGTGGVSNATTTKYTLYWDPNTPNDTTDDILVDDPISIGADSSYDMKWNNMFQWDYTQSKFQGAGRYRLNVESTGGSSENGFNLRAGPVHSSMSDATWSSTYGTDSAVPVITASGNLPMNFNTSGTVTVTLGVVPTDARGGGLYINKFDTDVDALSVTYSCTSLPGQTFKGTLSSNGTWKMDTIALPANYTTGVWSATYKAGSGDTSVWQMNYQNYVPGQPGHLRLIE